MRPALPLIAEEEGGAVVGHIMFSSVMLPGHPILKLMGLAPMAVDAVVVLGHPEYYPRLGFSPGVRMGLGCEYDVPTEAFMVRWSYGPGCCGTPSARSGTTRRSRACEEGMR